MVFLKYLTDSVFMDRTECVNSGLGVDSLFDLLSEVFPKYTSYSKLTSDLEKSKSKEDKVILNLLYTAYDNAQFTDKYYSSVIVHKHN